MRAVRRMAKLGVLPVVRSGWLNSPDLALLYTSLVIFNLEGGATLILEDDIEGVNDSGDVALCEREREDERRLGSAEPLSSRARVHSREWSRGC